ncbi:MAG: methylmalonyl Co-A mutase-associated GTPase MeaB, partial [Gammaproteobacteria bacterium]|nr:methylmalonyl Co-A mutase-associated GTPase MeaB [Gammaproteobacteria bacterium]
PHAGGAMRIGISGVPGVGKSTFVEALGNHIIDSAGRRVAVLAVDPSSTISGGSILGDKTRMERLSARGEAFIRPSPTRGTLGGVARRTREALVVCEAAGFDVVLIETVGVGQSETAVSDMTDLFVLLLLPGGGDDLQGIKRGIIELADIILVNKADGDLLPAAQRIAADYRHALTLLQPRSAGWTVPVATCSALTGERIDAAWELIEAYWAAHTATGQIAAWRTLQGRTWFWHETAEHLLAALKNDPACAARIADLEAAVADGALPPTLAAQRLVAGFLADARTPRSEED